MEEIMGHHIEHKAFSPLIAERSVKTFIQSFDPEKIYFTEKEIASYLHLKGTQASKVSKFFQKGDCSYYEELNKLICKAIDRLQKIREEVEKGLIVGIWDQESSGIGQTYLDYPKNEEEIRERIEKKLIRFSKNERKNFPQMSWTPPQREKVFALYERKAGRFEDTYHTSNQKYEHFLTTHILKAMARSLDSHTVFFSPEEAQGFRASLTKEHKGIGVYLKETIEGVMVTRVIKNGPADKSGKVQPGDLIIAIDGIAIEELTYQEILDAIEESDESGIELSLFKDGSVEKVYLKKEVIALDDERLKWELEPCADGVIAKLDLPSFYDTFNGGGAASDIKDALRQIDREYKLYGVILDLRQNLGGFLHEAAKVSGLFVKSGVMVVSKYAKGKMKVHRDIDRRCYYQGPLVIITSQTSASSAEITALALQDYGAAVIVGDKTTYGKGSLQYQTITDPKATIFYTVTVGKYYTVSGKSAQVEGVKADIVVPTEYSFHKIGEKYLDYPLSYDRIEPLYSDPLYDIDPHMRSWFRSNYLPFLQEKRIDWHGMLPQLRHNSRHRLEQNRNFICFQEGMKEYAESIEKGTPFSIHPKNNWGVSDLHMDEAIAIVKDMVYLDLH